MNLSIDIQSLFPKLAVSENKPLSECTTFQLGGPCPLFIDKPSADQLPALIQMLNEKRIPFLVIGQGSNLVVSDEGLDCAVIRFCSETPKIEAGACHTSDAITHPGLRPPLQRRGISTIPSTGGVPERRGGSPNSQNNNVVTVSGDTLLDDLALFTIEKEVGDLTFCSGIPGTVGGGIAGNAGAFGRQMGDHLISADILGLDGTARTVTPEELDFSYRHSNLKETGEIVLSAIFELPFENKKTMRRERERIIQFRKKNHPDWHTTPCAGSVFRNIEPTSAVERRKAAGYFLEEAGAKTMQVGGAHIFEKHANMIVGGEGCTAQDVWILSEQMKQAVQQKFDLELIREIRFLGRFRHDD